jgi:hypothetical protein
MQKLKAKTLFVVLTLLTFVFAILPFAFADVCSGQNCPADINLTISNVAPTIPFVYPVSAITLNGGTTKSVTIEFNATDTNGYDDLDFSSAQIILMKSGEDDIAITDCGAIYNNTETSTISCTGDLQFYTADGSWVVNASISDNDFDALNDTTSAVVNALDYVSQDVTYVAWGSVSLATDDNEADNTITLTNGGNQAYPNFDITGQNATGVSFSDVIVAEKFSVDNVGSATSGQIYMQDNTPVDVSSKLSLNSIGASIDEEIFFYVDIPSGISADNYVSDSAWAIQVS